MTPHKSAHKYTRKVRTNAQVGHAAHACTNAPYVVGALCVQRVGAQEQTAQEDLFNGRMEYMPAGPTIATEVWITRRLRRADLFAGVTDPDARRERIRQVILDGDMAEAIAGKRKDAECETWAQLFERVYGEALNTRAAA